MSDDGKYTAPDGSEWAIWRSTRGPWDGLWQAEGPALGVYISLVPHREKAKVTAVIDRLCPAPPEKHPEQGYSDANDSKEPQTY